ncbi:MAG: hypothetical protein JWP03_1544 [Phycisphaerales bacterium]|nr:hypothetical protein [Phycisphaerales bacterium]
MGDRPGASGGRGAGAGAGDIPAEKIIHNHSNHSKVAVAVVKTGVTPGEMNDRWDRMRLPGGCRGGEVCRLGSILILIVIVILIVCYDAFAGTGGEDGLRLGLRLRLG